MNDLRYFPFQEKVAVVNNKTLCVYGQNSNYVSKENLHIFKNIFSNISFSEIKNAGHYLHVEQPKEFYHTVRNFLIN